MTYSVDNAELLVEELPFTPQCSRDPVRRMTIARVGSLRSALTSCRTIAQVESSLASRSNALLLPLRSSELPLPIYCEATPIGLLVAMSDQRRVSRTEAAARLVGWSGIPSSCGLTPHW